MRIDESQKQALIVLGMHRSGTSAATRVLSLLGARLPGRMLAADQYNESGYWESAAINKLHNELLASVGSCWDDVSPFPESWFRSEAAKDFQSRVAEILTREYGDSPLFVLKDPRISRFVPFWISVLKGFKAEPSFVITVRNPLEVAASLQSRDGLLPSHSLLLWLRHMLEAERQTRQFRRTVVFYENLLSDPIQAMTKVAEDIGIGWPQSLHNSKSQIDAFLVHPYRHHVFHTDELNAREDVPRWVKQAYKLLRKADDSSDLTQRFDTIREELEVADRAFGPMLAASQLKVSELRGEIQHLSQDLAAREKEIGRLEEKEAAKAEFPAENERLNKELTAREKEIGRLEEKEAAQAEFLATRQRENERLNRELTAREKEIGRLEEKQPSCEDLLAARQQELNRLSKGNSDRDSQLEGSTKNSISRFPDACSVDNMSVKLRPMRFLKRLGSLWRSDAASSVAWLFKTTRAALKKEFDSAFYLDRYPEVRESNLDPLRHYTRVGWKEGRDPSPGFSTSYYLSSNPDVREARTNPFYHYVRWGRKEGRRPSQLGFKPGDAENKNSPLFDVNSIRSSLRGAFDADFYFDRYPEVRESTSDALGHYVSVGWKEGRDPSPEFSTSYYLAANPDVRNARINPLYHYLTEGRTEGRQCAHPGGVFALALENLEPLERKIQHWRYAARSNPFLMSSQSLRHVLKESAGPNCLRFVVSLSHDDYTSVLGGVQLCIGAEQNAVERGRVAYVNLHPVYPLPVLSSELSSEKLIVNVLCNGELIAMARCCDFLEALQELTGQEGTVDLVVHALHGHSPEVVAEIYEVLKIREAYFWLHDYFSLCSGYRLLRNEVSFCGAPPVKSAGCSICIFGEGRQSHVKRMRTLFDRVPFVVVSPSEFTLDLWKNRSSLPYREALIHPHCTFEAFDDGLKGQNDESGRIRIAFLGFPIPHKGWPVFIDLASRLRKDSTFEFYHLGSEPQRQCRDVRFFSVAARRENRSAMTEAMLRNGIDVVLLWSICPETFSFTAYEALAAGALIITHESAGNIPFVIRKFDRGLVFNGESELWQAFEDGSIRDFVKRRKNQGVPCGALEFSRGTLDLLNWEA